MDLIKYIIPLNTTSKIYYVHRIVLNIPTKHLSIVFSKLNRSDNVFSVPPPSPASRRELMILLSVVL